MKCRGKRNTVLHEIFRVVSRFPPLHFMLYRGKSINFVTVWGLRGCLTGLEDIPPHIQEFNGRYLYTIQNWHRSLANLENFSWKIGGYWLRGIGA